MSDQNIQTVQAIYAAFGAGDLNALLEPFADTIEWTYDVASSDVPWQAPLSKKSEIPAWAGGLLSNIEIETYNPFEIIHSGNKVVVRVDFGYKVKKTGKHVHTEQLHLWGFDNQGKVNMLRHYEDTAQTINAWRG